MDERLLALDFTLSADVLSTAERARMAFLDLKNNEMELLQGTVIFKYAALAADLPVTSKLDVNPYRTSEVFGDEVVEFGGLRFTDAAPLRGETVYVPIYTADSLGLRTLDEDSFSDSHAFLVAGLVAGRAWRNQAGHFNLTPDLSEFIPPQREGDAW